MRKKHVTTITELLLGAAYADKRLEGQELESIRSLVGKLLNVAVLPQETEARLKSFNPAKHDPVEVAGTLQTLSAKQKHKVLDLVATVTESDDEIDFAEDAYLRKVAQGLGLGEDDIKGMTIEILEESELGEVFDED